MDILNELKSLLTSGLAGIKEQIEQVDHDFQDEYKQEVLNKSYKLLTNSTD